MAPSDLVAATSATVARLEQVLARSPEDALAMKLVQAIQFMLARMQARVHNARIEAAIGKAVVSSNLATAWMCLRLCGDSEARPARGRLMTLPLPVL